MTLMLSETPSITRLSEEALVCLCRRNMPYMLVIEERGRPGRLEPKATETEAMAELVRILRPLVPKVALSWPRFGQGGAE